MSAGLYIFVSKIKDFTAQMPVKKVPTADIVTIRTIIRTATSI